MVTVHCFRSTCCKIVLRFLLQPITDYISYLIFCFYVFYRLFEFRKFVSNRDTCYNLIPRDYPVQITRVSTRICGLCTWNWINTLGIILKEEKTSDCVLIDGEFLTPMELFLPGVVPPESRRSYFQLVLPLKWKDEKYKPICMHFAGTGDHVRTHCKMSMNFKLTSKWNIVVFLN